MVAGPKVAPWRLRKNDEVNGSLPPWRQRSQNSRDCGAHHRGWKAFFRAEEMDYKQVDHRPPLERRRHRSNHNDKIKVPEKMDLRPPLARRRNQDTKGREEKIDLRPPLGRRRRHAISEEKVACYDKNIKDQLERNNDKKMKDKKIMEGNYGKKMKDKKITEGNHDKKMKDKKIMEGNDDKNNLDFRYGQQYDNGMDDDIRVAKKLKISELGNDKNPTMLVAPLTSENIDKHNNAFGGDSSTDDPASARTITMYSDEFSTSTPSKDSKAQLISSVPLYPVCLCDDDDECASDCPVVLFAERF